MNTDRIRIPAPAGSTRSSTGEDSPKDPGDAVPRPGRRGSWHELAEIEEQIRYALSGLKYGHVTITVHDGQVQRIDRVEQVRLFRSTRSAAQNGG